MVLRGVCCCGVASALLLLLLPAHAFLPQQPPLAAKRHHGHPRLRTSTAAASVQLHVASPQQRGSDLDLSFLDSGRPISTLEQLEFEREGHVLTRQLFSPREMAALSPHILEGFRALELGALQQKVAVLLGEDAAPPNAPAEELRMLLHQLPPEDIPFLQVFNMWRTPGPHQQAVSALVRSRRLARHAAALLGCRAVRVYQDSTFVKRSGDGPTNWHSDLNMAPLDTNDFVTAWLPLTPVAACEDGGSGLVFASRSHRDFALNYWADPHAQEDLSDRYVETPQLPMAVGDCSWHHGWVLHSANGNETPDTRIAFTVSYIADGARRLGEAAEHHPEQEDTWSYSDWIEDAVPGEPVDHPLVPLVFDFGSEGGAAT